MKEVNFRAQLALWAGGVEIAVLHAKKEMLMAKPLEFVEMPVGRIIQPLATLSFKQAQVLMDDLWQAGIRPTEGKGSSGAMRATEKHLEDMRTLVFNSKT